MENQKRRKMQKHSLRNEQSTLINPQKNTIQTITYEISK